MGHSGRPPWTARQHRHSPRIHRSAVVRWPERVEPRVPLLTSPQQCGIPLPVTVETDSWANPGEENMRDGSTTISPLEGCEELNLQPSFTMLPDTLEAGVPGGLYHEHGYPAKRRTKCVSATPAVQTVKVTLPAGVVISPSAAWSLKVCSEAEFNLYSQELAKCPREAQVGEVEIQYTRPRGSSARAGVPCRIAMRSAMHAVGCPDGRLLRLFAQVSSGGEEGVVVKLEGRAQISQVNGQVTVVFEDLPQLPIGELQLTLTGGQRALFANPRSCEAQTTTADVTPWSAPFTPDAMTTAGVDINKDCFEPEFDPSLSGSTLGNQAAHSVRSCSRLDARTPKSSSEASRFGCHRGLIGMLSGVVACTEAHANAGTCGPESKIGETSVDVGPGTEPYVLSGGEIFLTGPFGGAPMAS